MNENRIYIITPFYNRIHLFKKTYNSIIKQSFKNWQWVIIDDYSSIIQNHKLNRLVCNNEGIIILKNNYSKGAGNARNFGLDYLIKNKNFPLILTFIDSDDEWHQSYLSNIYKKCTNDKTSIHVFSYMMKWENSSKIRNVILYGKGSYISNLLNYRLPCLSTSAYIQNPELLKYCRFSSYLNVNDAIFFFKLAKKFNKIIYHKKILATYNVGKMDSLSSNKIKQIKYKLRSLNEIQAPKLIIIIAIMIYIFKGIRNYIIRL